MHGKTLVVFSQFVLDKLCIFEESQFIQILNTGHSHWVTNGTIHPLMNVYDSKYIAASVHLRAQIACLLMTQHAEVTINFILMLLSRQVLIVVRGLIIIIIIACTINTAYNHTTAIFYTITLGVWRLSLFKTRDQSCVSMSHISPAYFPLDHKC